MVDPAEIFARYGIGEPIEAAARGSVFNHGLVAEVHRVELVRLLHRAKAQCAILASALDDLPDDDRLFDLFDEGLGGTFAAAGIELGRFRQRRECQGSA